ncbi:MAG: hypothetical protein ACOYJB_02460 [Christensenellaceae bacterium]|jgi:hypothetical protein
MLKLWGKLISDDKILLQDEYTSQKPDMADALLECIEYFAKEFDIEAPIWHTNHTKQLGLFGKAIFKQDDFIDQVGFDRFEIQILDRS